MNTLRVKNEVKKSTLIKIPFWERKTRGSKDADKKIMHGNTNDKIIGYNKSYPLLLSPSFIKICSLGTMIAWSSALLLGIIIGQFDQTGPNNDLAGFNPLLDYVSNLGSFEFTPIPIAFNFSMMLTCLFSIPVSVYTRKMFNEEKNVFWKIFASCLSIFLIIGFTTLFFAGFVNLDVSEILNVLTNTSSFIDYHSIFSNLSFAFLGGSSILLTVLYLFPGNYLFLSTEVRFPILSKILLIINTCILTPLFVIFMASSPGAKCSDRFWIYLPFWKWAPMWEWLTVLSLTVTIFWLCIKLLKPLNRELQLGK